MSYVQQVHVGSSYRYVPGMDQSIQKRSLESNPDPA